MLRAHTRARSACSDRLKIEGLSGYLPTASALPLNKQDLGTSRKQL